MTNLTISWSMIFLIIGALLSIGAIVIGKKKITRQMFGWIGGIAVISMIIVIVLGLSGVSLGFLNNPVFGKTINVGDTQITYTVTNIPSSTSSPPLNGKLCAVEDTTVTLSGQNKYTALASGGTHRYRINGAPALTVSDAGTFTASPYDKVEVLWGNGTLTGNFGVIESYEVPCSGTKTFNAFTVNNGTLTTRVFNEEGNLISDPENETLGAGDVVNLNWEIQGAYQTAFPFGLVLVIEYNSTTIDNVVPKLNNVVLATSNIPISYSGTSYGGQSGKKAYLVPPAWSNDKQTGTLVIDTDDTNNPGSLYDGDISFTYFPLNDFINEDKGGSFDGPSVEDEDNAQTRTGTITYTLSID